ncbi:TetR/AcrR family transcriptional regulator [Rhodococcus sp. X156]|uniref:TetR/AcrR family transcriptional regulator n=1 Tax=Rhodococcus sp. X156 TaxID=2499145 RepID=UPI000FD9F72D|nr:TetR/AcrR family transcriptional regulator [Rhodococcus sp. X156]
MPRNTPALRSDARANLERILDAARQVFALRGLEATLAEVAEQAQVGVGTVYRRFTGKDELIERLFVSRLEELMALARSATEVADPWEGLVSFLTENTRMLAEDRGLRDLVVGGPTRALCSADTATQRGLVDAVEQTQLVLEQQVALLVRRAKEAGALRPDVEATDLPILALSVQAASGHVDGGQPELWRRTLGIVLDGLRASRDSCTALETPALSTEQLHTTMRRIQGLGSR